MGSAAPLARIDDQTWSRVQKTVDFFMENGQRLLSLLQEDKRVINPSYSVRGVLIQDVFGNGSGLMHPLVRSSVANSFMMSLIGINPPKQANFTVKLYGANVRSTDLIFTADIVMVDGFGHLVTNSQLQFAMSVASVGGPYPLDPSEINVQIGNPYSSPYVVGDDPVTYPGRWTITFTPEILSTYPSLVMTISNPSYIGLSAVVVGAYNDVVCPDQPKIVTDVYNRPQENPWAAGSIVVCVPMVDAGLVLVGSDYRDVTYQPPAPTP